MAGESDAGKPPTGKQKLLFYTTAFFILLGIFSFFGFLFLVPFVIEPAFTTIFMAFDLNPAQCVTLHVEMMRGASNCSWTSCREGCTREIYECTQIRVSYKIASKFSPPPPPHPPPALAHGLATVTNHHHHYPHLHPDFLDRLRFSSGALEITSRERRVRNINSDYEYPVVVLSGEEMTPEPPMPTGLMGNDSEWYFIGAKLFPNVKGCGYPPMLNCSKFLANYSIPGTNFSCYYSTVDPGLVITQLDMWQVYMHLVYSLAIPIPSFICSVIYLTLAYFYIYSDDSPPPLRPRKRTVVEITPLALSTPNPPPTSGALTPASEVFRDDMASFGHQLKVAMADDFLSGDSLGSITFVNSTSINGDDVDSFGRQLKVAMTEDFLSKDSLGSLSFLNSTSVNGNLNKMMTTCILTPPGPIAEL